MLAVIEPLWNVCAASGYSAECLFYRRRASPRFYTAKTLNRHERPNFAVMRNSAFFNDVVGYSFSASRKAHETARIHHASQRCRSVAARGDGAAGRADAAHRRAAARGRGQCGISDPHGRVPGGITAAGLDRRPQCSHRHTLGRWRCGPYSQIRRGTGRARAGRCHGF